MSCGVLALWAVAIPVFIGHLLGRPPGWPDEAMRFAGAGWIMWRGCRTMVMAASGRFASNAVSSSQPRKKFIADRPGTY